MINTGKNLDLLGVEVACISCITAHYFQEDIQNQLSYHILNAIEEVHKYIKNNYPQANKVGVLATTCTIKTQYFI